VTNYTYDPLNNVGSFAYSNGVTHGYSYDQRYRVTGLTLTNSSSTVLATYAQTFSPAGHKLTASESPGRDENYAYDLIYRLTNETISGDPTPANNGSLAYGLDPVANRKTLTSTLGALPSQSFTYDADDRLSSDTYDTNGNTLSSGGATYTYDFEDRLLTTSTGVQIVYDGDGNRVGETVAGATTRYLVDEMTPTSYPQVTEETVGGTVAAQFAYGKARAWQNRGGTVRYFGYDAGWSTRLLVSPAGAVTDTYSYDAFGNAISVTGSDQNEFLYRGEQFDLSLGMYYLRARYYNPRTGRFSRADPHEGTALGPWTFHQYLLAHGDPVNFADPSGMDEESTEYGLQAGEDAEEATELEKALDDLRSLKRRQRQYRQGKDVSCIIDSAVGSANYTDYLLKQIKCLADLDE
jgi:RHS repeat-associated protein